MKIEKSTIVRTIAILIVVINIVLEKFGIDVIDVDEITILAVVEAIIEIAIIVVGFWYNNSFSQKALRAQEFLKELRESE